MHVDVLCAEVAPLEAVDWAEVALLAVPEADRVQELPRTVAVPDADLRGTTEVVGNVGMLVSDLI